VAILTPRDTNLILDVHKYKLLSVPQIQKLHFPSLQTAYRRLRALTGLGYLKGFLAPLSPEQHLYHLGKKGAEWVAGQLNVAVSDLGFNRTTRPPDNPLFLKHFVAISDFRIALSQACQTSQFTLRGFIPEFIGTKAPEGNLKRYIRDVVCDVANPTAQISHTPDATFALESNGICSLLFLEIDLGTEVVSSPQKGVLKSLQFYLSYLVSGQYRRYQEDFHCQPLKLFRVLYVTTSEERIRNIRRAATEFFNEKEALKLLLFTEQKNITPATLFTRIWQSADANDPRFYQIA
jgi:Replication-relaxation